MGVNVLRWFHSTPSQFLKKIPVEGIDFVLGETKIG